MLISKFSQKLSKIIYHLNIFMLIQQYLQTCNKLNATINCRYYQMKYLRYRLNSKSFIKGFIGTTFVFQKKTTATVISMLEWLRRSIPKSMPVQVNSLTKRSKYPFINKTFQKINLVFRLLVLIITNKSHECQVQCWQIICLCT